MRYENNEYLRRWLLQGGAYEYASVAHFDFEDRALEAAAAEVQQQHPYLSAPEARARAAYRLLTKHRRAPEQVVAPLRARLIGIAQRNAWRAAKVAWAVAVLAALLLLAARAKAEPPRDLPPGVRTAVLARGLFAQQSSGLIVQFQNQGSVLSTRPAGLVVLNCSTNMSCSFSGSTFTLTSSSTASTAFSAITTGTNTSALTMGTGGTFTFSGTGIVNANQYKGGNASGTGSCGANLFVTALADAASPTCTQPAFGNLSGAASSGQVPHALLSAFHTDSAVGTVVRGDLIAGIGVSPTWQRVARGGTNGYPKWNVSGDLVASSGAAAGTGTCTNQFVRTENADAAPTCASVSSTDFANQGANLVFAGPSSGGAAAPTFRASVKADLPASAVYTDQANTYTAGTQDFEAAAVTRPLRRLAFASFPATCTANREFLERSDPAAAGQVVYVCNAAGTGWDLVGDGGGGGGGLGDPGANGVVVRTALNTTVARTITGTTSNITVTNGDGVAGNPTLDLGATAVQTDQANTWTTGTQDFESASVTRPFRRLAFASFPATCTANREFLERSDPATAGQVVYVCNAAGTGWDLVGDGGGAGGSDAENVVKLGADVTNTTTTLADATGLSFTAAANTTYLIEIWVIYTTAATTTGINLSVNGPAAPTSISFLRFTGLSTNAGAVSNFNAYDAGTANASALTGVNIALIKAVLANAATSGTFILRFASEVAGNAVTIKAGSTLRFRDTAVSGGGGGGIGGSGTANTLAKFTAATTVGNSSVTDDGVTVSVQPTGGLVVPKQAGAAPTAQGDIRYDTTQDATKLGGSGAISGAIPRVLSAQFSSTDSLTCSVIGTTETAFATAFAIPANFFKANKVMRVSAAVEMTTPASQSAITWHLRVQKAGPTNVNLFSASSFPSASLSSVTAAIVGFVQGTGAPGATATLEMSGFAGSTNSHPVGEKNSITQPVTVDTTVAQTLQFTLTCTVSDATNLKLRQLIVEELN